jgi:prenyltransferase beta subunit
MSQRLQMLQVARLARRTLGDSADLVVSFIRSLSAAGGGFCNRGGVPDLYYTSFALDALVALDALPGDGETARATAAWLDASFGDGGGLDLVHRGCLARAWAAQPAARCPPERRAAIAAPLAAHRAVDGGYSSRAGARRGSAYGCFLAVNAHADLKQELPDPDGVVRCIESLRSRDGAWSNEPDQPEGSTTATAAAVATLRVLGRPVPPGIADWFLARFHPAGGFTAAADAPIPDLLSTAVALHALDALEAPWRAHRDTVLDFLDSLWSAEGAFHGSWADDQADAEYTFYGLVALGHASV